MTAPADVWCAEDGGALRHLDGVVRIWLHRHEAARYGKPVRFRLVRVDEPEQPQRCSEVSPSGKWSCSREKGHMGDHAASLMHRKDTQVVEIWPPAKASAMPEQPPRDDVGELRECVRELADIVENAFHQIVHVEAHERDRIGWLLNRLAAQSGPAGEVGDGR